MSRPEVAGLSKLLYVIYVKEKQTKTPMSDFRKSYLINLIDSPVVD
jgi:hypothetical protein